jgi:hypothetical protein
LLYWIEVRKLVFAVCNVSNYRRMTFVRPWKREAVLEEQALIGAGTACTRRLLREVNSHTTDRKIMRKKTRLFCLSQRATMSGPKYFASGTSCNIIVHLVNVIFYLFGHSFLYPFGPHSLCLFGPNILYLLGPQRARVAKQLIRH